MKISIIDYEPRYKDDFMRIGMEWLTDFDIVEDYDIEVLSHPEEKFINNGGYIWFAKDDETDDIAGSVALMKTDEGDMVYEVCKMGVTKAYRGKNIGETMMKHLIETAKQKKIKKLILYTNEVSKTAHKLYHRLGFETVANEEGSNYELADIKMELIL